MDDSASVILWVWMANSFPLQGCLPWILHWISGVVSSSVTSCASVCGRWVPPADLRNWNACVVRHGLTIIYASLTQLADGYIPPFLAKWELDLGTQFTDSQKKKILNFSQKSFIATRTQETSYTILTRWYRVPINPTPSLPTCPQCLLAMRKC